MCLVVCSMMMVQAVIDPADSSSETPRRASSTISNYINKATKTIDKKYLKQAIEKRKQQPPECNLIAVPIFFFFSAELRVLYFTVLYKRRTYAEQKEAYLAKKAKDKKKK